MRSFPYPRGEGGIRTMLFSFTSRKKGGGGKEEKQRRQLMRVPFIYTRGKGGEDDPAEKMTHLLSFSSS